MSRITSYSPTCMDIPREDKAFGPVALRIELVGSVQGLGVRPAIARWARELNLVGTVENSACGVLIHIEGPTAAIDTFRRALGERLPTGTSIESRLDQSVGCLGANDFSIQRSSAGSSLAARVPRDLATCQQCLAELRSADNRRHGYAFTTCTSCGPRYSLIEAMPYDRAATSMDRFTPCPQCGQEYSRPEDRRFHSQTNSCPTCGPALWLSAGAGSAMIHGDGAMQAAIRQLQSGAILGVRGIGGYQLLVDATSPSAVERLRQRKRRFGKPLAVMVADPQVMARWAYASEPELQCLTGPANPIVLLAARRVQGLAASVRDGFDAIGVMLPSSPLHDALARGLGRPLVVTSGNHEGEPLAYASTIDAAAAGLADVWLEHDRPIARPIDDSVVRVIHRKAASVRLARGLAPWPLDLQAPRLLALGAHQKAAIALSNSAQAVLGPHIGDLDSESARERYLLHIRDMCRLYGMTPELLVCDQHPDYFSSRWAAEQSIPTMAVQHHHAHVAAGMLDAGWLDRRVLGVAWDGTGYGSDGTIWGGEFLVATATESHRMACLRPFLLPGGEAAVREPWRVAVSLVHQSLGAATAAQLRFAGVTPAAVEQIVHLLEHPRLCVTTTSAGRLFDGAAALILGRCIAEFEGQPAMLLESAADPDVLGE